MKRYHDIVGDGGSRILEQVAEQRARITDGLAGVRHLVAVGSGKGGVGKSTLTLHLAGALRARGLRIAILDADFNGPSQARMAGVQGALFVPGSHKVALPRTRNGIGVFSMGSLIPESEALEFESAARESPTRGAPRGSSRCSARSSGPFEWGALDLLMFDLPPGAERTVQYADFLGPRTSFLLVTIPSEVARGVVARSVAALSKGPNRLLGYVENMSGYYCRDCNAIKPLFVSPGRSTRLIRRRTARQAIGPGDPLPRDRPVRSRACAALRSGIPLAELPETPVGRALDDVAQQLLDNLESTRSLPDEVSLRSLRQPDEAADRRPARARLAVGRLLVSRVRLRDGDADQSVRDAARPVARRADRPRRVERRQNGRRRSGRHANCPFTAMIRGRESRRSRRPAREPIPVRWTSAAEARLANIPAFVRPMAKTGIERFARERGTLEVDEKILDAAKDFFGM